MAQRSTDEPQRDPVVDQDGSTLRPLTTPTIEGEGEGEGDRDERLGEAIEAYLEQAEGGQAPDPIEFARGYPDLGEDLVAALEGLALVKGLVGGPSGPGHRLEEGRRVAGYRIVREIGRGGMGIVYEAVHVGLDRPVALKVLGSQAAPDSSGRRRFLNEARTAAGLHHTHIVPVFDVGQVGGLCYYAMQRIEGSGLDRVLKALRRDRTVASGSTGGSTLRPGKSSERGSSQRPSDLHGPILPPLPTLGDETLSWAGGGSGRPPRWRGPADGDGDEAPAFAPPRGSSYYRWVARVGQQAAEALAHAHQRGIIHRDIKPSNLLVDARGTIWVADFGLARRLADPSQTQVDSLLGTPRYMSPEQARTGAIDGRADVYSLGATLYELITLRPPFDGQTAAELIDQITGREVQRPRRFDSRVPLDLETILLKALAKRPSDRYPGAADLADDLGRFLAHEPVRARRIGPIGRTWRFARRHPGASTVSVLATSAVLTIATVASIHIVRARNQADDAARVATRALKSTEVAVAELRTRNQQLQAAALDNLEKQAANTRLTAATNRRAEGLNLIRQAVTLAEQMRLSAPLDPGLAVRLRDQATAFLTTRDIEARPRIETPNHPRRGLVFGSNGQRLAALDINGELSVWDPTHPGAWETSGWAIAPALPRRNGNGGGPVRFVNLGQGDRIAQAGDQVAAITPERDGVAWFDLTALDKPSGRRLAIPNQRLVSIYAADDGLHLLTVGELINGERPELVVCLWDCQQPDPIPIVLTPISHRAEGALDDSSPPASSGARRPGEPPARLLVAFAPDGSRVALAFADEGKVLLWDAAGKSLDSIPIAGVPSALALGPSGILAVAESVGEVALWDLTLAHPKLLPPLDLHQGGVNLLRFNPRDGSTLAIASNGGVELWDLATHAPIVTLPTSEIALDLAFAPDGRTLAAAHFSRIALWSLIDPTALVALPESGDELASLAFGPGGLLAIAARDGNHDPTPLQLWGGPDRCSAEMVGWTGHRPTSVGFDALGRLICPEVHALRWFQPPHPSLVASVALPDPARGDAVGSTPRPYPTAVVARSLDGLTLLVQREMPRDRSTYLWQQARPSVLEPLRSSDSISEIGRRPTLSPDGTSLFALNRRDDGPGRREDWLTRRPLTSQGLGRPDWATPLSNVIALAIKPDGSTLAVGLLSGVVELRDAATGRLQETLPVPNADDAGPAQALAFSPDGRTLAVGGRKQVRLWSVAGRVEPILRLPGYRATVRLLAFDSTSQRLAAADDKTVKVWNLGQLSDELGRLGLGWGTPSPKIWESRSPSVGLNPTP